MSQLRVLICRVDENDENKMTEIVRFAVPEMEVARLEAETAHKAVGWSGKEVVLLPLPPLRTVRATLQLQAPPKGCIIQF